MIIKNVYIKNFRSYYGENRIELSDGLTLIIGGNGDGKTTFFEALEWLMNTSIDGNKPIHISEKRKKELSVGESDETSVSISFEHEGEKELVKRFRFTKNENNSIVINNYEFIGYYTDGGEHRPENGAVLLDKCFESEIRRYCMFKGESNLNIFDREETAVKKLVETFSDIRQFDEMETLAQSFETKTQNVVAKEMQNDKKTKDKAEELNNIINAADNTIKKISDDITNLEQNIKTYTNVINQIETIQETSEKWQEIKKRITSLEDKIATLRTNTQIDYNTLLLDECWILKPFGNILNEYRDKVSKFGVEKRRQERLHIQETTKREVIEGIQQLANGADPLPWNLPDRATMQEMLNDEVCKVCGRPAPKGSDAYNFMLKKLDDYMNHIRQQKIIKDEQEQQKEESSLFKKMYIEELNNRSSKFCDGDSESWIAGLTSVIYNKIQFINAQTERLNRVKKDLQDAITDRDNLLIQSPGLSAELLDKSFKDYKGNYEAKESANIRLTELTNNLRQWKKKKEEFWAEYKKLEPTSSLTKHYVKIHDIFNTVLLSVEKAKENNIDSFITLLQDNANEYLQKLNKNDFYGIIKLRRKPNGGADILLESSNGTLIDKPNGALKTTMYMSVLFAVSKITTLKREQDYPLIFDAPTSSFEDFKEEVFYNIIDKIDKQCIIATKDLLLLKDDGSRELNMAKINQLSCSVYRIQKAPDFDDKDLSTIQTIITKIK